VLNAVGDDAAASRPLYPFLVALIDEMPDWRTVLRGGTRAAITVTEKSIGSPGAGGSLFDLLTATLDQRFERATRPLSGAERGILQDVRRRARRQPTLIIADNAHWWDAASVSLLAQLLSPKLREAVPELRNISVLLVDTLADQAAVDDLGYSRLLKGVASPVHTIPAINRSEFPSALRLVGLTTDLPDDIVDLLFAATGAHLKLCEQLVGLIEQTSTERLGQIGESDLVTQALSLRLEALGSEGGRLSDILSAAALIGLRFNLAQLACLVSASINDIRTLLVRAEAANLVQVDAEAATFTHDVLRVYFQARTSGVERQQQLVQLARCLTIVRPAEYELRARLLLEGGESAEAREAFALAAVRRVRDGASLALLEADLQQAFPGDEGIVAFAREMAEVYRLVGAGNHAAALQLTVAAVSGDSELMAAERAYAAGLCWMEQQTHEGFVESQSVLTHWRQKLAQEPDLHIRFGLLIQQALVLSGEFDAARDIEKEIFVELSRRATFDPEAGKLLQVQNRRAAGINTPEIAESRIQRAVSYFRAASLQGRGLIDFYKSLSNHAAVLLALARNGEALAAARSAESLILENPEIEFPRRDVLGHNLTIAAYRAGQIKVRAAIVQQEKVVDSVDGRSDNFLQRCALAGFHLLAGNVRRADAIAGNLMNTIELEGVSEAYLLYYAAALREAISIYRGDWDIAAFNHATTAAIVAKLRWTSAPFLRRRASLVETLLRRRPELPRNGDLFDTILIRETPQEIGPTWLHHGRLVPMSDLAFWSDD